MVVRYIGYMVQVYTVHGEIHMLDPRSVYFAVQGVISSNELGPAMGHFPIDKDRNQAGKLQTETEIVVPRDVGSPFIDRMVELTGSADECYRNNAYKLDHVWETLRDRTESRVYSLEEVATQVFQQPSMSTVTTPMLWCLYRAVIQDEKILIDTNHHRAVPRFTLLSQKHYDDRLTVLKWVRDYQECQASDTIASIIGESESEKDSRRSNALYSFIQKAQIVVRNSRELRSLTPAGQLGLSKIQSSPVGVLPPRETEYSQHLNANENKILRCLIEWALTAEIYNNSKFVSIGPAILRATGLYDGFEFEKQTGFLFLKELGVITPWENRSIYRRNFPMPGLGVDPALDEMQKLANSSDFVLKDSMKNFRKDWGDMPIFCIDSLGTEEVDDGISVETIDDASSWVHIHVANPSAFIDKDSAIAKYAARLSSTLYLIDRIYFMLGSDKLRRHCSLAPGCPSITFSARMNLSGDILETKVTHGILRNVIKLTPGTVNQHIYAKGSSSENSSITTVGGEWPAKIEERNQILTDSDIKALLKLRELGTARRLKRNAATAFSRDVLVPEVDLGKAYPPFGCVNSLGRRIVGDPLIALQLRPFQTHMRADLGEYSEQLVGDLMLLAGEVAAKWSAERGLPIAFSGTSEHPKAAREAFYLDVLQPALKEHGCVHRQHFNHYITLNGRTVSSPVPIKHAFLNIPMYCKTTSPLRRWSDLFTHWQIDAAVRYEANEKVSLVGNTNDHFLPFSYTEAAETLKKHNIISEHCSILDQQSRYHWIIEWFRRAYYHEGSLPKILTAFVMKLDISNRTASASAVIKEISIQCTMNDNAVSRAEGGLEEGDCWEIEIERIDIYHSIIQANPIRLLEKSNIPPYPLKIS